MTSNVPKVLFAHPSAELYGSDRMLLESVRALVPVADVLVVLPVAGPLVSALQETGADVRLLRTGVLRKAALRPRGALSLGRDLLVGLVVGVRLLRAVRPEAVLVNTVTLPAWLLAARCAGSRVVCHVHEAEEGLPRWLARGLTAPLLLADLVLVNSAAARDVALAAQPRLAGRTRVLHNGVPGPGRHVPLPGAPGAPARLLLVGRLSPRKGTDVAVAAVQELRRRGRPVVLDLVGNAFPGYEWYERQLREQAAVDPGSVRFHGFREDVWDSYAQADVVLVPSRAEPFGNVAVEALLAGRPLVAAAAQGLVEVVRAGEIGLLVPPGDPGALADAVERVLEDWAGAGARAIAGRRDARTRFSPSAYAERLQAALLEPVRTTTDSDSSGTISK